MSRQEKTATAALLLQTLLAVGTYLIAKAVTHDIPAFTVIATRTVLSAGVLVAVLRILGPPFIPPKKDWVALALLGLAGGPINQGAFLYGLSKTHPAHASLLYALTPAGVYLAGLLMGREQVAARRVVGIVVAFAGVFVLLFGKMPGTASGSLLGDAWVLVGVAGWVMVTVQGKPLSERYGAMRFTSWILIASGLWVLPFSPWLLNLPALQGASVPALLGVTYLVLFSSVASYALWNFALARIEASAAAIFSNLQPVGTALAAWAFLGEPLTVSMLLGGALVLGGVRLSMAR